MNIATRIRRFFAITARTARPVSAVIVGLALIVVACDDNNTAEDTLADQTQDAADVQPDSHTDTDQPDPGDPNQDPGTDPDPQPDPDPDPDPEPEPEPGIATLTLTSINPASPATVALWEHIDFTVHYNVTTTNRFGIKSRLMNGPNPVCGYRGETILTSGEGDYTSYVLCNLASTADRIRFRVQVLNTDPVTGFGVWGEVLYERFYPVNYTAE